MKINPIMNPNILQSYRTNKATPAESRSSWGGTDEVSFSQEAMSFSRLMSEIKDQVETSAPDQKERVEQLKAQVREGSYRIDSDRLAESILGLNRID